MPEPAAMRTVIQDILAAEAEAKALLQEAQREAEGVLREAREASARVVAQSRAEARAEAERIVAAAAARAADQEREHLAATERAIESGIRLDAAVHAGAVERVAGAVLGRRI